MVLWPLVQHLVGISKQSSLRRKMPGWLFHIDFGNRIGLALAHMLSIFKSAITGSWLDPLHWSEEQRKFAGTQVFIGSLCVGLLPIWILVLGGLTLEVSMLLAWSLGPFISVYFLVQTRFLDGAVAGAFASLTGLFCTLAMMTGGLTSFALIWILMLPIQAVLLRNPRHLFYAMFCGLAGVLALYFLQETFLSQNTDNVVSLTSPLGIFLGPIAAFVVVALLAMNEVRLVSNQDSQISSSDFAHMIAENSKDLITFHDRSGDVLKTTSSASHFLGKTAENILGKGYFDRVHVADRPHYMQLLSNVVTNGEPAQGEIRLRTSPLKTSSGVLGGDAPARGSDFSWVELTCRPIFDANHVAIGALLTTHNISERKLRQDELEHAHKDLKQLSEAKSRFLANMSHELRTPLNAIIGFSEILEQEIFGRLENEKQKEYVSLIRKSGAHLLQVVTDVLDVSKIDSGTFDIIPEPFDVGDLVMTCVDMMGQHAENQGVELRTVIPDHLPEAVADPRACRQILINLISNAIKFTEEGGRVSVGVRLESHRLAYFVRDNGVGLSKDDLERVGQPFFQADSRLERKHDGTGLGISVVKGLTELHKGEFVIESTLNEGTCVTVFIPLICELEPEDKVSDLLVERENTMQKTGSTDGCVHDTATHLSLKTA